MVDEFLDFRGVDPAARGDFAGHNPVIKINQHLAQIKNNDLRWHHKVMRNAFGIGQLWLASRAGLPARG